MTMPVRSVRVRAGIVELDRIVAKTHGHGRLPSGW